MFHLDSWNILEKWWYTDTDIPTSTCTCFIKSATRAILLLITNFSVQKARFYDCRILSSYIQYVIFNFPHNSIRLIIMFDFLLVSLEQDSLSLNIFDFSVYESKHNFIVFLFFSRKKRHTFIDFEMKIVENFIHFTSLTWNRCLINGAKGISFFYYRLNNIVIRVIRKKKYISYDWLLSAFVTTRRQFTRTSVLFWEYILHQ